MNEILSKWLDERKIHRRDEDALDPRDWFGEDGIFAKMNDFEIVTFQQILAKDENLGSVWDVMTAGPDGWIEAFIETITT